MNQGRTNSETFWLFLMRLCLELNSADEHWRDNTIILLDNAPYHRSDYVRERLERYGIPTLFLGPYHYRGAPVEMLFSHVKNRDLNFMRTRASSR